VGIAEQEFGIDAQLPRALLGDGEHGWALIDASEPHATRVEGEVQPGADLELQGSPAGTRTNLPASAAQHN